MILLFVTSNKLKFDQAAPIMAGYDVELKQRHMDLQEIQAHDGETIARHKAQQAYDSLQQPLVVNDDEWIFPGLSGFPGPYMKDVNQWLTPDDWLHLTRPLTDRRVFLRQHNVYQDEHGQHYFNCSIEGLILSEQRGQNPLNHLTILSFDGGTHSGAEVLAAGKQIITPDHDTAWQPLGRWLQEHHA